MKILEYIGVILASVGFGLIALDNSTGFLLGIFSCLALIPYFLNNKMYGLALLQSYFLTFNFVGYF